MITSGVRHFCPILTKFGYSGQNFLLLLLSQLPDFTKILIMGAVLIQGDRRTESHDEATEERRAKNVRIVKERCGASIAEPMNTSKLL